MTVEAMVRVATNPVRPRGSGDPEQQIQARTFWPLGPHFRGDERRGGTRGKSHHYPFPGQLRVATAGIGTSRPALVETPTAVS